MIQALRMHLLLGVLRLLKPNISLPLLVLRQRQQMQEKTKAALQQSRVWSDPVPLRRARLEVLRLSPAMWREEVLRLSTVCRKTCCYRRQ